MNFKTPTILFFLCIYSALLWPNSEVNEDYIKARQKFWQEYIRQKPYRLALLKKRQQENIERHSDQDKVSKAFKRWKKHYLKLETYFVAALEYWSGSLNPGGFLIAKNYEKFVNIQRIKETVLFDRMLLEKTKAMYQTAAYQKDTSPENKEINQAQISLKEKILYEKEKRIAYREKIDEQLGEIYKMIPSQVDSLIVLRTEIFPSQFSPGTGIRMLLQKDMIHKKIQYWLNAKKSKTVRVNKIKAIRRKLRREHPKNLAIAKLVDELSKSAIQYEDLRSTVAKYWQNRTAENWLEKAEAYETYVNAMELKIWKNQHSIIYEQRKAKLKKLLKNESPMDIDKKSIEKAIKLFESIRLQEEQRIQCLIKEANFQYQLRVLEISSKAKAQEKTLPRLVSEKIRQIDSTFSAKISQSKNVRIQRKQNEYASKQITRHSKQIRQLKHQIKLQVATYKGWQYNPEFSEELKKSLVQYINANLNFLSLLVNAFNSWHSRKTTNWFYKAKQNDFAVIVASRKLAIYRTRYFYQTELRLLKKEKAKHLGDSDTAKLYDEIINVEKKIRDLEVFEYVSQIKEFEIAKDYMKLTKKKFILNRMKKVNE